MARVTVEDAVKKSAIVLICSDHGTMRTNLV